MTRELIREEFDEKMGKIYRYTENYICRNVQDISIDEFMKYVMNVWFPNFVLGVTKFNYSNIHTLQLLDFLCRSFKFYELNLILPYLIKNVRYKIFNTVILKISTVFANSGITYSVDYIEQIISTFKVFHNYEKGILNGILSKITQNISQNYDINFRNEFFKIIQAIITEFGTDYEKLIKLFMIPFPSPCEPGVAIMLTFFPFSDRIVSYVYKASDDLEKINIFKTFKTHSPKRLYGIKQMIYEFELTEIAKFKTDIFTTLPVELSSMILSMSCNHDTIWDVPGDNFYEKANRMIYKLNTVKNV